MEAMNFYSSLTNEYRKLYPGGRAAEVQINNAWNFTYGYTKRSTIRLHSAVLKHKSNLNLNWFSKAELF